MYPFWCFLALFISAQALSATVTADDYARAERFMPHNTEELVLHTVEDRKSNV